MCMPKFINTDLSLGNILTILTMIISLTLGWGKISSSIDEMQQLRSMDLKRIEKVETLNDHLQERVFNIEKQNIEFKIDLQYIKTGVLDIQTILKQKSSNYKN